MSVYNGSQYLRAAVDSILNQTFEDFEFIIVDDCSTDESWSILQAYAKSDPRVALHRNAQNLGLTKTLNACLKLAKGTYIARQDDDDISLPNRLSGQVRQLGSNPQTVLVSSNIEMIDGEGQPYALIDRACEPDLVKWYLLFYNHIGGHSQVMFRKDPVLKLGGYNETYRYAQDYELWCRLSTAGQFCILPTVHLQQRFHTQSISAGKKQAQTDYVLKRVGDNLESILGDRPDAETLAALFEFWTGSSSEISIESIHQQLKEICEKYFEQNPTVAKAKIEREISRRFFNVYATSSLVRRPWIKWSALRLAIAWNFSDTFRSLYHHSVKRKIGYIANTRSAL